MLDAWGRVVGPRFALSDMQQHLTDPMAKYKSRQRSQILDPLAGFDVLGYIAAGTYGRVYKAREREASPAEEEGNPQTGKLVAIKKFKSEKEGTEQSHYTGLSQSAYRELALCRELSHPNIVGLVTTILHEKSIYLVFDYAEHDLLQLIQCHCAANNNSNGGKSDTSVTAANSSISTSSANPAANPIDMPRNIGRGLSSSLIKSVLYQVCQGVAYLHANWVLHRDLKPANIMITANGRVKIGDLGLARIFRDPLQSLYAGDKVVVTVWYRAPELLLGCRHYTPAIDMWAVGCILAEMLSLRPIFKGDEVTAAPDKQGSNFQTDQVDKMTKILGTPSQQQWPNLAATPAYWNLNNMRQYKCCLSDWHAHFGRNDPQILEMLKLFFNYNPDTRISAVEAVDQAYFAESSDWSRENCFAYQPTVYPPRRVATSDANMDVPPKRSSTTENKSKRKRI